jgi:hypothetical protein
MLIVYFKLGKLHQHAKGRAQQQVGFIHHPQVAFKTHCAVVYFQIFSAQPSQLFFANFF